MQPKHTKCPRLVQLKAANVFKSIRLDGCQKSCFFKFHKFDKRKMRLESIWFSQRAVM